jgi:hypothetical protein
VADLGDEGDGKGQHDDEGFEAIAVNQVGQTLKPDFYAMPDV